MLHVVAVLTAKTGRRAALLAAFAANVPNVRAENGCIEYGAATDAEGFGAFQAPLGPDGVIVIEKWESADALRAHAKAPHMLAFFEQTKDLVATRAVHVLSPA